jgi:hypothetical protein
MVINKEQVMKSLMRVATQYVLNQLTLLATRYLLPEW